MHERASDEGQAGFSWEMTIFIRQNRASCWISASCAWSTAMSEPNRTNEGSDWYRWLCNSLPRSEAERLEARRDHADQIRTRDRGAWTDLPDKETMNRMIEESVPKGVLPYWTHGTPSVHYHPYNGGLPAPKPIIFENLFLGYELPLESESSSTR